MRGEPPGEQHAHPARRAFGQAPVEDPARAGIGRVDEDHVGRGVGRRRERGIAGRERLDHEPHPFADPLHLGARLAPVELHGVQTDPRGDVDDVRGLVVAEHADRHHLDGQSPHDVADGVGLHLPPARGEHEAERVGAQRDGEQRVVLVGDAADLDEHARYRDFIRRSGDRG